jgi:carbon-monoxide dehydrogenase medium subunit
MRPGPFELTHPKSLQEAASQARDGGVLLGGGQSLIQSMRLRNSHPSRIVSLKRVAELSNAIELSGDTLKIGALTTISSLLESRFASKRVPMLIAAARRLGDVQVRNRATVVGNVCWADPRANLAIALLAYDAVLRTFDGRTERTLPVANCFSGFRSIALTPGEIVTSIEVQTTDEARPARYLEFSRQRNDLALVNMAVFCPGPGDYRVAAGGLADTPLRLRGVERLLVEGGALTIASLMPAIEQSALVALGDPFGSLAYKVRLGAVLLSKILQDLNSGASHDAR